MENEIELYEWLENSADLYAPDGMERERYDEYDEDDEFDADADWRSERSEDAFLDSLYEERYEYEDMNSYWD
jgi:hypothetical protein